MSKKAKYMEITYQSGRKKRYNAVDYIGENFEAALNNSAEGLEGFEDVAVHGKINKVDFFDEDNNFIESRTPKS